MVPTIAMAIVMGVVPGMFLRPMEPAVARVIERVTGAQPARVRVEPAPAGSRSAASDGSRIRTGDSGVPALPAGVAAVRTASK